MSRARDLADGTFSGAVVGASADFTGTVEAADFSDGTLTVGTEYVTNGSAKAWVNLNGEGTIAIRDSFNVSSVTDNGTGDHTHTFSFAMGNINYSGTATNSRDNNSGYSAFIAHHLEDSFATTSYRVVCGYEFNGNSTVFDSARLSTAIFGDLA